MRASLETVLLPVGDPARSREFYGGRLGWRIDADPAGASGTGVVTATPSGSAGGVAFGPGDDPVGPASRIALVLAVDDVDALRAELLAAGVDAPRVEEAPAGRVLRISDPDGNSLAFRQAAGRG